MSIAVTIFADFICPFSYLAEAALGKLDTQHTEVRYRAARVSQLPSAIDDVTWGALAAAAADEGVELRRPSVFPATAKAHESALFAREQGREEDLRRAIYQGYWRDGLDIGRIDVLTAIASSSGFDPEDLKIALDIDKYSEEVLSDLALAERLQIAGTPVTYFGTGSRARVVRGGFTYTQLQALMDSGAFITESTDG